MTHPLDEPRRYIVVESLDLTEFEDKIHLFLREGWRCQGGVFAMTGVDPIYTPPEYTNWCQAMVRDE